MRGALNLINGNLAMARKLFEECLRQDPDHRKCSVAFKNLKKSESLKQQGNDALKNGDLGPAYEFYTQALEIDPSNKSLNSILHCNRAQVLFQ